MPKKAKAKPTTIVIRRDEIVEGGHHGGAWKVAYADFVTAMMAFFLLMWLINATTEKQRRGLADYFSPIGPPTRSMSGSGKPFGGLTPNEVGSMVSNRGFVNNTDQSGHPPPDEQLAPETPTGKAASGGPTGSQSGEQGQRGVSNQAGVAKFAAAETDPDAVPVEGDSDRSGASGRADAQADADGEANPSPNAPDDDAHGAGSISAASDTAQPAAAAAKPQLPPASPAPQAASLQLSPHATPATRPVQDGPEPDAEARRFTDAARAIKQAIQADPGDASRQVAVDVTADELRIQIFDAEGKPMFDDGSVVPNTRARHILAQLAPVLAHLGEPISIVGHTDASPCSGHCGSNWELSAARADATRAALVAGGLPDQRVAGVAGLADHDLLLPSQPDAPANRRVVMIVHRSTAPAVAGAPAL